MNEARMHTLGGIRTRNPGQRDRKLHDLMALASLSVSSNVLLFIPGVFKDASNRADLRLTNDRAIGK
jgi:hypothetical protein